MEAISVRTLIDDMIDEFHGAYVTAALWSSTDNADPESGGEPFDENYDDGDISYETAAVMLADCRRFLERGGARLIAEAERLESDGKWSLPAGADCLVAEYAGHDFWLTRNGHGCGFWDGDWPDGIGEKLDRLAKSFGTFDLYVGDDGLIHGA